MLLTVSILQKSSNPDSFSPVLICQLTFFLLSCCIYFTKQTTSHTAGVTETIPKYIKLTDTVFKNSEVRTGWEDTDSNAFCHNMPILNSSHAFTQPQSSTRTTWTTDKSFTSEV